MDVKHIVFPDGSQEWRLIKNGQLHREDGPALMYQQKGTRQEWWLNGRLHRADGPAIIYSRGNISPQCGGYQEWWFNGVRHRIDGPAILYADWFQAWWINGMRHRDNGPAVIYARGDQEWYINGKLHRTDGPAIISDNYVSYYNNGVIIKKEQYVMEIHDKFRFKSGGKTKAAPREYLQ